MTVFSRFPERLQHAIANHLGFTSLRDVQELAGEAILDGKNAVVLAPTAGGKTEASMFPVLAQLLDNPPIGVGAIYVAPIKALLNNQEVRLGDYTQMVGVDRFVWHGDAGQSQKQTFCREPTALLMTTPESLEVMLMSPRVPVQRLFGGLQTVVIDEIHAFAGTDRGAHLMSVLERLAALSEHDVQRIGLSATIGNPEHIARWLAGTSRRESVVVDPPKPKAQRQIKILLRDDVSDFAREAARETRGKKSLFFCQSRSLTEAVADEMRNDSIEVFVHHGSVSKEERRAAEEKFAQGTNACIVATSTLELGIDVGGLDLTFQANAPSTVSSFLQRMGRTGRREGTVANMTFLCEDAVSVVQNIALVQLASRGRVESVTLDAHAERGGSFVLRMRALVGEVQRAVAVGLELVLPVAAVREVVAALAVTARPFGLLLDAVVDGWVARQAADLLGRRVRVRGPGESFGARAHRATPGGTGQGRRGLATAPRFLHQQVFEPVEVTF